MSDGSLIDDDQRAEDESSRALALADFLPYRIAVLGRRMSEELARVYGDENLTIPEWRVLAVISQKAAMAARDVVAMTPMDKMAVSRAVASLEAKGFVRRSASAGDRRVADLSLTPAGRRLFDRIAGLALSYEASLFAGFSDAERRALDRLLARLENGSTLATTPQ